MEGCTARRSCWFVWRPPLRISTGMKAAQGILTVRGGMTSHAAVVARGMGTCCVSGCGEIAMDEENKQFTLGGKTFHEGDFLSIDGSTGNIYDGVIATVDATISGEFGRIMGWADEFRRLSVRTNADTPRDAKKARELGAEGIGLCRTEHMFFEPERIAAFREMICADTKEQREHALEKILPYQQSDFEALYEALEGTPVTIRFLDPPLHEFVPTEEADIEILATSQGKTVEQIKDHHRRSARVQPHDGSPRLPPDRHLSRDRRDADQGCHPRRDQCAEEAPRLEGRARDHDPAGRRGQGAGVRQEVRGGDRRRGMIAAAGSDLKYEVGTMIEIPRAALTG